MDDMDSGAASGVAVTGEQPAPRLWSLDRLRHLMIDAGFGDVYDRLWNVPPSRVAPSWPPATYALIDVDGPGDDGQDDCAICLYQEDATAAAGWKETPCRHRFHGGCLDKWLRLRAAQAHTTCPLCRREIPTLPPVVEEEAAGTMAFGNGRVAILFEGVPASSQGMAMDDETDDEDNQDIDDDDCMEDSDDGGADEEDAAPIEHRYDDVGR